MSGRAAPLIVVVGMVGEARIARRPGAPAMVGAAGLEERLKAGAGPVLSFGLCGGLDPGLKAGDLVIATAIIAKGRAWPTDPAWTARLAAATPWARRAAIFGAETFVADAAAKSALRAASGAGAVDTESHLAEAAARRNGVAFAAVRAVCDGAARNLPPAARVGLAADGRADLGAVLASLAAQPGQLAALVQTALEARAAFRALRRAWPLILAAS